jgi:hypothetical protein
MPTEFQALTGMAYDKKNNRVFSAEQIYGRVQMFRYYTDDEAKAELEKRRLATVTTAADGTAAAGSGTSATPAATATGTPATAGSPANEVPAQPSGVFSKIPAAAAQSSAKP